MDEKREQVLALQTARRRRMNRLSIRGRFRIDENWRRQCRGVGGPRRDFEPASPLFSGTAWESSGPTGQQFSQPGPKALGTTSKRLF